VDANSKVGVGAYLLIPEAVGFSESLQHKVVLKRFGKTSSTQLELETLLWAWGQVSDVSRQTVIIYTDSQNILSLLKRRSRLEASGFRNKEGKRLKHEMLYRCFYRMLDEKGGELIKVKGHSIQADKDEVDHLFQLVDRASRKGLRELSD